MKYLKLALQWLKSNVVIVICVIVAIGSVVMILRTKGNADKLRADLTARAGKISQLKGLQNTTKTVPSSDPNLPAQSITLTVTPAAIERIDQVFQDMKFELGAVYEYAMQINAGNRVPMLEGLFPEPPEADKLVRRNEAAQVYRESFRRMFEPYSPTVTSYPQLNARLPRSHDDELASFERNYLTSNFLPARTNLGQLSQEELAKYYEARLQRQVELIRHDAEAIHLYADPNLGSGQFPFAVGSWSTANFPSMAEIWQGQMDLWLQQDVARAIARANNVSSAEWNVMAAPVKVLISVSPTSGAVAAVAANPDRDMMMGLRSEMGGPAAAATPTATADEGLSKSPTGRVSNELYDVRYVNVKLIADFKQLPELFEAITHTNFMTVISLSIKDVDEYEWLKRGYHFGGADAVEVTMTIETLWLRAWLLQLMPDEVLQARGLQRPQGVALSTP